MDGWASQLCPCCRIARACLARGTNQAADVHHAHQRIAQACLARGTNQAADVHHAHQRKPGSQHAGSVSLHPIYAWHHTKTRVLSARRKCVVASNPCVASH
eukprot:48778-Chlamydomonas_euryale.AAC.1